jgi:hypothetical protein
MSKNQWKALALSLMAALTGLIVVILATASVSLAQVTSVSQLIDVQPTDWYFQALQNLAERYGVSPGYPDGTFRGNRSITRGESAVWLNTALERITELMPAGSADHPKKEEITALQQQVEALRKEVELLRQSRGGSPGSNPQPSSPPVW